MPAEVKKEIELEIAHVLFLDIVGCSKLSVNEQHEVVCFTKLSENFIRLSQITNETQRPERFVHATIAEGNLRFVS
jgi:hypothetical protein